jgi:hypothetical protein
VQRPERDSPQNQQIQRARQQLRLISHGSS